MYLCEILISNRVGSWGLLGYLDLQGYGRDELGLAVGMICYFEYNILSFFVYSRGRKREEGTYGFVVHILGPSSYPM